MQTKQLTPFEIIDETVQFYSEKWGRRAVSNGLSGESSCQYITSEGNRCAVGRCMNEKVISLLKERPELQGNIVDENNRIHLHLKNEMPTTGTLIDVYLKSEYMNMPLMFWRQLQALHDNEDNWGKWFLGLTVEGMEFVREMKNRFRKQNNVFERKNKSYE